MKDIISYLDDLKGKYGSDYRSAKMLNISKEAVSKIRKRNQCSDETALRMAKLLDMDEKEILLTATISRSTGEVRKAWVNISKLSRYVASIVLIVISMGYGEMTKESDKLQNIHYAKCYLSSSVDNFLFKFGNRYIFSR